MIFRNRDIELLAVGDIAVDNFIKIFDVEERCDIDGHCKLCFRFGDKIPYQSSDACYAAGNSSNVAISAAKLGLNVYLVSYVGDDHNGKKSINTLKQNNVKTDFVKIAKDFSTNYHYVLWHDTERTILVNHASFLYSFPQKISEPKWMYLSSLSLNSESYHNEILKYLNFHSNIKLVFQPGTFQMKMGLDKLKEIYERTEIFICNKEEAQTITGSDEKDYMKLINMIYKFGPKIVVLTDGMNGSCVFDGKEMWMMKPFPQTPYEKTGAGDAFSSAFVVAIILGKKVDEALMWGSTNAMSVVTQVGPHKGLMTREQIEDYLKNIEEKYKPTKLIFSF